MKRKNPTTLFYLIKAMNRGEKRFFNLFCNRQENKAGKNYIKLFEAIQKQEIYDESLLKKESKNYGAQFHLIKSYLYKLVQESLTQYYTANHSSLHHQLLDAKVLCEKGLFEPAQRMLYNLRKSAEEQNNYNIALETINIEEQLLLKSGSITEKNIYALQKQRDHYMTLYTELESYKQLYVKVAFFNLKYVAMHRNDVKKEIAFKKIAHSILFKKTRCPNSVMSKYFLSSARGMYYKILWDDKKSNKEYFAAIRILDNNPELKKNYPDYVIESLKDYVVSLVGIKKYDLALQKISELKAFCSLYSTADAKIALIICQGIELDIYTATNRKNETILLLNRIEKKIEDIDILVDSTKLIFYCNLAIVYTLLSDHQKSLSWVNKVLNFNFAEKKSPNIYCYVRIIQLINLTELKEYDLLFYRLKSIHRFLGKQNSIYRYQEILMHFIRGILKGEFNKSNILVLYDEMKKALVTAFKDPEEANACAYFDFVGWIDSKINHIPYNPLK